jgi:hypothetical protein
MLVKVTFFSKDFVETAWIWACFQTLESSLPSFTVDQKCSALFVLDRNDLHFKGILIFFLCIINIFFSS